MAFCVFLILPQDQGAGDLLSQKVHLGVIARESASLAFLSLEDEIEKWLCRDTGPLRRSVVPLPPEASRTTYFFFFNVYVWVFYRMHVSAPYACLVPGETRKRVELEGANRCELPCGC